MQTLVQQMTATESLAAVDTICIDKTGTLTSGELELVGIEPADPATRGRPSEALARFAASAGERNRTLQAIAETYPGRAHKVAAEVPFSSEWKWSGLTLDGGGPAQLRARRARCARRGRVADAAAGDAAPARAHTAEGGASSSSAPPPHRCPATRRRSRRRALAPLALIVLEETLRPDSAETIAFMREQEVELKLISGTPPRR